MKTFFKELFEYNNHFNTKLAESFLANQYIVSKESVKVFCHILNAHEIWNSRIQGKTNIYEIWQVHNPVDFAKLMELNQENTNAIIEGNSLNEVIQYSNGKVQRKIQDILFHMINHSTYHRGQIAIDFRECEIEPIATDYIHYKK
ncbi:damage-inducible protein DinB [Olivibacter sp. SDN3]|uniref:DinB family protein n=1 Tax=Olivibacter sp. SDN3 TaxID=2764720 RepID=UPI001650F7CD|nr:DinB family protein [Olivibacter sp. SDN3]QNL51811.1 damage-inducible protein DinB [Olivibacter sp. SDN3]